MNKNRIFIRLSCYNIDNTISPWYIKGKNCGIGNILFQVASGLCFGIKHNAELYVPSLTTYFKLEDLKKEETIFKNINTDLCDEYDESNCIEYSNNHQYIFDCKFYNNIVLVSYFENYYNFNDYRDLILDYFRPSEKEKEYIINKYPNINDANLSSIHIRGGPDIQRIFKDTLNKHKIYYNQMIDYMIEFKGVRSFFVITNDKEFSYEILNNVKYNNIKFYYTNERDYYDIWIISLIKYNIVSFSTLAWWGSYLNEHQDKFILSHIKIGGVINPEWSYLDCYEE